MADDALSKKITELADEYLARQERYRDPAWADAEATRAMLQGMVVGASISPQHFKKVLKVVDIEQDQDIDGVYQPWFTVNFESGAKIRVSFEVTAPSRHL